MKKVHVNRQEKELAQAEVVTLAVFLLGGEEQAVDTEDIAVKAHELAPGRFSWRKYPDQINLELVRVYLSDAKKPQRGALIDGSGRSGWVLTPNGQTWARGAAAGLADSTLARSRAESRAGSIDESRWRRERKRITATPAWGRWVQRNQNISIREAEEVFRIDAYAVGPLRQSKITRLLALFEDDLELESFLVYTSRIVRGSEV